MRRLLLVGAALCAAACDRAAPVSQSDAVHSPAAPLMAQTGWVTDLARIVPPDDEQRLSAKLSRFKALTQHQLVIVTVTSLGRRSVDEFAHDLFNQWGVGRKGINDGVMILVAPTEQRVRIQVGYGLERQLTDVRCAHITRDMDPHFARGDFPGGIEVGADAIIAQLSPPQPSSSSSS